MMYDVFFFTERHFFVRESAKYPYTIVEVLAFCAEDPTGGVYFRLIFIGLNYTLLFLDYTLLFLDYTLLFLDYTLLFLDYTLHFFGLIRWNLTINKISYYEMGIKTENCTDTPITPC